MSKTAYPTAGPHRAIAPKMIRVSAEIVRTVDDVWKNDPQSHTTVGAMVDGMIMGLHYEEGETLRKITLELDPS